MRASRTASALREMTAHWQRLIQSARRGRRTCGGLRRPPLAIELLETRQVLDGGAPDVSDDLDGGEPATISGVVWNDDNANGIRDEDFADYLEAGVAGVEVKLFTSEGDFVAAALTDQDGGFNFNQVASGSYYVAVHAPAGLVFTAQDAGADEMADSDVGPGGKTPVFVIGPGETLDDVTAGVTNPLHINVDVTNPDEGQQIELSGFFLPNGLNGEEETKPWYAYMGGSAEVVIDWDDGSDPDIIPLALGETDFSAKHTYADNGDYEISVEVQLVFDDTALQRFQSQSESQEDFEDFVGMNLGQASVAVSVDNVNPQVFGSLPSEAALGEVINFDGSFKDPGFDNPSAETEETFYFEIDWGDDSPVESGQVTGVQQGEPGVFTLGSLNELSGGHAYEEPGEYLVTLTIFDDDEGFDLKQFLVVVREGEPDEDGISEFEPIVPVRTFGSGVPPEPIGIPALEPLTPPPPSPTLAPVPRLDVTTLSSGNQAQPELQLMLNVYKLITLDDGTEIAQRQTTLAIRTSDPNVARSVLSGLPNGTYRLSIQAEDAEYVIWEGDLPFDNEEVNREVERVWQTVQERADPLEAVRDLLPGQTQPASPEGESTPEPAAAAVPSNATEASRQTSRSAVEVLEHTRTAQIERFWHLWSQREQISELVRQTMADARSDAANPPAVERGSESPVSDELVQASSMVLGAAAILKAGKGRKKPRPQ